VERGNQVSELFLRKEVSENTIAHLDIAAVKPRLWQSQAGFILQIAFYFTKSINGILKWMLQFILGSGRMNSH
jgi:hypothetical protein